MKSLKKLMVGLVTLSILAGVVSVFAEPSETVEATPLYGVRLEHGIASFEPLSQADMAETSDGAAATVMSGCVSYCYTTCANTLTTNCCGGGSSKIALCK